MRNKRFLSTVVATALVASTMAMPVMAADGGQVDVEFTTKTPVIRVEVPTTILAAVDPLEMNTPGTQIHSSDFSLKNKSEVPVGIDVKSVVDLGSGVTLVDTKAGAADSKGTDAWVAVAALTSAGKYTEADGKTAGDLDEKNKNVATFKTVTPEGGSSESSASQTFYLNKGTGTAYKLIVPAASGGTTAAQYKASLTYAQVYELTEDTTIDDADKLAALVKTKDVYTGSADTDGTALTFIAAGTTSPTYTSGNKYFTASTDNKLTTMADGTKYVYGETGTAGEDTAFRYIGKLGQGKASWSDTDIDEMHITYSIYGLTDEKYTAADKTYGLYTPTTTPTLAWVSGKANSDVVLKFTPPAGKTLATDYVKVNGVDTSGWGSFGTSFAFDTTNNTVTVKAVVFGFSSITAVTTNHKYTFAVKDTDGTEYSTDELDLSY